MPYLIPIDIEDALRLDLTTAATSGGFSFTVAAPPIPTNLGNSLPYAVVSRIGGTRDSLVVDTHSVGVDVWADNWADAQNTANTILGLLCGLPYSVEQLTQDYLGVDINALPYNNPDPDHDDVPRVSFTAQVQVRAAHI